LTTRVAVKLPLDKTPISNLPVTTNSINNQSLTDSVDNTNPVIIPDYPVNENSEMTETNRNYPTNTSGLQPFINSNFPVDARSFVFFDLALSQTSLLKGMFVARGGNNDIDCLIMEASELENFKNNQTFRTYYRSGYITTGNINLSLPAGTYKIVFSNTKAWITNKTVVARFVLESF
jgi:hypothetical protein